MNTRLHLPLARQLETMAPVLKICSVLWLVLALFMTLPWAVLLLEQEPDASAFGRSILIVGGCAAASWLATWRTPVELRTSQIFILTTFSWASICALASLPLILGSTHLDFTNAVFESVSAITTTGSTVLTNIEGLSDGIKLWRGIMQWLGGIGIIVMGIAILPFLKVGGMRLFHTESSDWSEKVLPRTGNIAKATLTTYCSLSALAGICYWLGGMAPLDAVVHAMTSLATGGFANSDASFGTYAEQPHLLWLGSLFMLAGAIPFVLYIRFIRGQRNALWQDVQVRGLLALLLVVIAVLTIWRTLQGTPLDDALTHVTFNVVSIVSTTGYASEDYTSWGPLAVILFFYLMFTGGCSGSTSGGVKIFRYQVGALLLRNQLRSLVHPSGVFVARYNDRVLSDDITRGVVAFSFFYFLTIAAIATVLGALGLDFITALSASITAVSNVGPGLGEIVGPAGNFAPLSAGAKWVICVGMLLGRLEILTVLVLLAPAFWRK